MNAKDGNMCEKIRRVDSYDILRIIITLLVVIGHSNYLAFDTIGHISISADGFSKYFHFPIYVGYRSLQGWIYSFHMACFFCLSGAMYALGNKKSIDSLVLNRAGRLLVPYFFAGLFFMLPMKYIAGYYNEENIREAISTFLGGGGERTSLVFASAVLVLYRICNINKSRLI